MWIIYEGTKEIVNALITSLYYFIEVMYLKALFLW